MFTLKRLLVPVDFSSAADRALDMAIDVAKKFDADLIVAHVYTLPTALYGGTLLWPTEDYRRAAADELEKVVSDARARYPKVGSMLVEGAPHEKILEIAKARGVDLIVMGTQGRRGLAHALLGSVTERVLRSAPVPVLTVSEEALVQAERRASAQAADTPPC